MNALNSKGHVAKIMNDRQLIITLGQEDGVEVGDYVGILDPTPEEIPDPVAGVNRGSIVYFKVALRVTHVSVGLSVAATYKTRTVNRGGVAGSGITNFLNPPKWEQEIERFNGDQIERHESSLVSVGDDVVRLEKEEADTGFYLMPPYDE